MRSRGRIRRFWLGVFIGESICGACFWLLGGGAVMADPGGTRIAEMAGGWANPIMQDEASFIALEGV